MYRLSHPNNILVGSISLPFSKSISNRVLIIQQLCNEPFQINNLSHAQDTKVLINALNSDRNEIDVEDAGTALRFLTAFLACKEGKSYELGGSKQLQRRPIWPLVSALQKLGADIKLTNKQIPLKINGKKLKGGIVELDTSVSSQFISALLLIAPTLEKGLKIHLLNDVVSKPYIIMTLKLMEYFGISYTMHKKTIEIKPQQYVAKDFEVEADWSALAFWAEMVCLSSQSNLIFEGLHKNSIQGDALLLKHFEKLGLEHYWKNKQLLLSKKKDCSIKEINLLNTPDLAQAILCTSAVLNNKIRVCGLQTLIHKETNRLKALKIELKKCGTHCHIDHKSISIKKSNFEVNSPIFDTYNDHRMAMSFAPFALINEISIKNPEVVQKSYPNFWKELKKVGFKIFSEAHSNT